MAEKKRFYWIKLKENFFDLETIDWLMSQKNGCEYIVLYQKLCLMTANKEGKLAMKVGEMIIPYDANKIARDTKFSIDTVVVALELFKKIGLVYEQEDGILHIPYVNELVGSETPAAIKKRAQREKKRLPKGDNVLPNVQDNVLQEIEKEKRDKILDFKDKDVDVEKSEASSSSSSDYDDPDDKLQIFKGNIFLSENQMGHLLDLMGLEIFDEYIARLQIFIENNNANIKSHYQTLLKWYNEDRGVKVG